MRLQYEISATGVGQLKRVFRSVEQEAHTANKRAVDRSTRLWARSLAQIKQQIVRTEAAGGRVATRAGAIAAVPGAPGRGLYSREHGARLANISREERARLRAITNETGLAQRKETVLHRLRLRNIEREEMRRGAAITRQRAKQSSRWPVTAQKLGVGAARTLGTAVGTTAGLVGGIAALGGGFAAMGAIRNQMDVERESSVLAAKAIGTPGEKRNREEIRTSIMQQAREEGTRTGLGAAGVIGGLSQFTAISGRLGMGQQLAGFMSDVADASGAAVEDVGRTSGQIVQAMLARGMTEPEALAQTKEIIAAMMAQAKVGSIEFSDLATQMGKVMSSTASFEGNISELASSMGAAAQLAIANAASSPEEAMTAILRMRDDMVQNAKKFRALGVDVFTYDKQGVAGKMRDPMAIIRDTLKATKGDLRKVAPLFGVRGQKAFGAFQNIYTEKGGGEKGMEAVNKLLETAMATMPKGEIETSAAFRRQDVDKRIAMNMEKFNAAVGTRLLPVVSDLVPRMADLIPTVARATEGVAKFASWAIKNPYQGIGALIAAKVGADLAGAGLQKVVGGAITRMFTKMPATSIALTAATVTATIGALAIDTWAEGKARAEETAAIKGVERESLIGVAQRELAKTGDLSPETRKKLLYESQNISATVAQHGKVGQQGVFETLGNTLTGRGPGFEAVANAQRSLDYDKAALEDAKRINALLTKAAQTTLQASEAYLQAVTSGSPGQPPVAQKRQSPILNRG